MLFRTMAAIPSRNHLRPIGRTDDVRAALYALSVERRLKPPAVVAICDTARRELFDTKLHMKP